MRDIHTDWKAERERNKQIEKREIETLPDRKKERDRDK